MVEQESMSPVWARAVDGWKQGVEILTRLYEVARPNAVFSVPHTADGQTVITATEAYISVGMGYGAGGGEGIAPRSAGIAPGSAAPGSAAASRVTNETDLAPATPVGYGSGGGGGGGGFSFGRPVAAIIVNSQGVRVEPIVDVTKIALAFMTMLSSMFFLSSRMRRPGGELDK